MLLPKPGGARHNADYQANESLYWNFSTYGASVYSEKRSTPIFLANANFNLAINPATGMPTYTGAATLQDWDESEPDRQHVRRRGAGGLRTSQCATRWLAATPAVTAASGVRPRIRSAAFSAIMMIGALMLAPTRSGITDAVDHAQAFGAEHAQLRIDHGERIGRGAHLAGAERVVHGDGIRSDMGVEIGIGDGAVARRDLPGR